MNQPHLSLLPSPLLPDESDQRLERLLGSEAQLVLPRKNKTAQSVEDTLSEASWMLRLDSKELGETILVTRDDFEGALAAANDDEPVYLERELSLLAKLNSDELKSVNTLKRFFPSELVEIESVF